MIIEDVTTSGKSIEETFPIIKAQGDVEIKGLIVSLNRMERGKGTKSALDEIKESVRLPNRSHRYHGRCNRVSVQQGMQRSGSDR